MWECACYKCVLWVCNGCATGMRHVESVQCMLGVCVQCVWCVCVTRAMCEQWVCNGRAMDVQWVCKALSACSVWWECGGTCVTCVTRAMCIVGVQCPCHRRAMGVRGAECVGMCVLGVRWVCKGHAGRRARVVHGVSVCVCVCVCVCHVSR